MPLDDFGAADNWRESLICDDCNTHVSVYRDKHGRLSVDCSCGDERTIHVSEVLPEAWTDV